MASGPTPSIGILLRDRGGTLSRSCDLEGLARTFARAKHVARWEVRPEWLDPEGLATIREVIRPGGVNRFLLVGRFTQSERAEVLRQLAGFGLNPHLVDFCAPEEQGIRKSEEARELNTKRFAALLAMALARVRLLRPLEDVELPAVDAALVVGGGIAGLSAAAALTSLGKLAYVVEQSAALGGRVAQLSRYYPRLCDPRCGLEVLVRRLQESHRAEVYTLASLEELRGSPGNYQAVIQQRPRYVSEARCTGCGECVSVCPVTLDGAGNGEKKAIHPAGSLAASRAFVVDRDRCPPDCRRCDAACPERAINLDEVPAHHNLKVGAVIVATGWDPYPLDRVEEYGYGRLPHVVSNLEMERLLAMRALANREAGVRGEAGALSVGFIQCAGSRDVRHLPYCSGVCCSVTLKQILALKGQVPGARCVVFYMDLRASGTDELLYQRVQALPDVVFVKANPATVRPEDGSGRLTIRVEDTLSGKEIQLGFDWVVLAGGLTPSAGTSEASLRLGLPRDELGFLESHLQCQPWEGQRTGIYNCGTCRGPMNVSQSVESANSAVVQSLRLLGSAVRVSPPYPVLDRTRCDKCKRCTEECPFAAYAFDDQGFPAPDPAKCRRCGICQGSCPMVVLSLGNETVRQLSAQIEALSERVPVKGEPVLVALLCENDAAHAAADAARLGLPLPPNVFSLRVRCAGAVNNATVADALACGIDGVLVGGCRDGQCHYVRGNELVKKRSGDLAEKLKQMRMDERRVRFEAIEVGDARRYRDLVHEYVAELARIGPNPFQL